MILDKNNRLNEKEYLGIEFHKYHNYYIEVNFYRRKHTRYSEIDCSP